jgi:hypothetical protein
MTTTTKQKKTPTTKALPELPTNAFMHEILEVVSKQRSNAKKVEALKKYDCLPLKSILIWNFDESVISLLPPGEVPYGNLKEDVTASGSLSDKIKASSQSQNSIAEESQRAKKTSIRKESTKLYNFVKGGNDSLSSIRREVMFINILEGLHPEEAEILVLVKDKKLSTKYKISFDNVKEAYPDITWGGRS